MDYVDTMIEKTKQVYFCEHCGKYYIRKYHAERHENGCHKNPDNLRICFDCEYCKPKKDMAVRFTSSPYTGEDEHYSIVVLAYCEKIKEYVRPYKAERLDWEFDIDAIQSNMRKECDLFLQSKSISKWHDVKLGRTTDWVYNYTKLKMNEDEGE